MYCMYIVVLPQPVSKRRVLEVCRIYTQLSLLRRHQLKPFGLQGTGPSQSQKHVDEGSGPTVVHRLTIGAVRGRSFANVNSNAYTPKQRSESLEQRFLRWHLLALIDDTVPCRDSMQQAPNVHHC